MNAYVFRGHCYNVVDGDTVDCMIDVGFHLQTKQRLRLWGVNAPEKHSKDLDEREAAQLAQDFVTDMILGKEIMVQTYKADSFGRYLAKIFIERKEQPEDGPTEYMCLNDLLVEYELAVPYMTNTKILS